MPCAPRHCLGTQYPDLKGIVFDLPPVAARATASLAARGLSPRVTAVAGSFFEPLPQALAGCDVFYLKFILHDWDDTDCETILRRIAAIAKKGAKVVTCVRAVRSTPAVGGSVSAALAAAAP